MSSGFKSFFSSLRAPDFISSYDITPSLSGDAQRGDEIREWLSKNPVDNFIILDDDSDMLKSQLERFVQTSYNYGLRDDSILEKAENILYKK